MPKNKFTRKLGRTPTKPSFSFVKDRRFHLALGFLLFFASIFLVIAFVSYLFTGKADQSVAEAIGQTGLKELGGEVENWAKLGGAWFAHLFIYKWFGVVSFLFIPILFIGGCKIVFKKDIFPFYPLLKFSAFFILWFSFTSGYFVLFTESGSDYGFICGGIGYEMASLVLSFLGWIPTAALILITLIVFVIYFFNVTVILDFVRKLKRVPKEQIPGGKELIFENNETKAIKNDVDEFLFDDAGSGSRNNQNEGIQQPPLDNPEYSGQPGKSESEQKTEEQGGQGNDQIKLEIEQTEETSQVPVTGKIENYDPTLDLPSYKYPTSDLLNEHAGNKAEVTKEELVANKDKIIETLGNYDIGISNIRATIGPTVTLYEIVPDAGIRISKIRNLEDDIALSLAALGIRIIAPMPGKGTIGIEVPNKHRETVTMYSVLSTNEFLKSDKELPIILGKTISNEVYIADLAKMPHLLMAGATGQGKSVGLNAILTSLIYKKHPSQLKFVLIDPKQVELSLFNKIEKHFLAKLPDSEEPIITDTRKVVHTLNSLGIEMETRYALLKDAGCRLIKEYNTKFIARRLSPEKGHRFLPYIVLVIDELADLMMTAGKEVETPIARLAQIARAVGIHLVVATQRPSVNIITGVIKANFPARLSYKVTSKIDSRTILDTGGAEQLVGNGDMLLSNGSNIIRLQCPFIDTAEAERVCEYIGEQKGYETAYLLPEYYEDNGSSKTEFDVSERDSLFEEAARIIVTHQQGSTSLLQRKLEIGYNRAGRLMDQLEAFEIVGPFNGSKAREVFIMDDYKLEQLLRELEQ
ncbi:MAG: DNA translocase FtsK [Cytophagales bacterium]|nr:DNA translocase FtsK [Cytophagales bacterium]